VKRTRSLHRASRKRVPYPVVALVGYTNAGKSTLFNRLTSAEVLAQDMLFATLDPTLRAMKLPHGAKAMLSDTVGFISELPTHARRRLPRHARGGDRGRRHPACP
jgi:GTP-binding protein HflX